MTRCLKVLDLFSGPGGLSEGFTSATNHGYKFDVIVANDNDPYAAKTYQKNHPKTEFVLGSITSPKVKARILSLIKQKTKNGSIDVVIGGPPCKGFSLENKMTRNMDNPMNYLVMHYMDIIKKTNPDAFVMENVPGLLSIDNGNVVKTLIDKFKSLGYHNAEYWLLNAAEYGVPQIRRRAVIIGSKNKTSITPPKKTNWDSSEEKATQSPFVTLMEAISDLPKINIDQTEPSTNKYVRAPNEFQKMLRKNSKTVLCHTITRNSKLVKKRIKCVPPGGNWKDIPERLMKVNGKYKNLTMAHSMIYKRLLRKKPSITITNFRKAMIIHPTQNRLLSVREAARIQTFPDNYVFVGSLGKQQQQVSDAVPVFLAKKVASALLAHIHDEMRVSKPAKRRA